MRPAPSRIVSMGNLAFAATIVAAFLATFLTAAERFTAFSLVTLSVLGLVYIVVGTYVYERYCLTRSLPVVVGYLTTQFLIGGLIIYLSPVSGQLWMIWLPLMAHAVVLLPRGGQIAFGALLILAFAGGYGVLGGWKVAVEAGASYTAAVIFVAVFTDLALRAERARDEVERLAADLRAANDKLREYAVQAEEFAMAKERNRLAREIHDSLGHYLTVINIQLEAAQAVMESDRPRARDALRKAQSLAQEGLADVRRSVAALRASPIERRPLPEALAALVDENRAAGIVTELVVVGAPRALSPQTELTLYRAAQEGLTNVRKHARASRAEVALDYGGGERIRLKVCDNGVGGSAAEEQRDGYGLIGVRERAQLLRGEVRTHLVEGQGFTLEVELPG
jgi:signal transduction histidine kinase